MTSALSIAISACLRIWTSMASFEAGSIPPVSTSINSRLSHSHLAYILSLVTPGVSSTIDRRFPMSLLKSVDFPTLGLPTIATTGNAIYQPSLFFYIHLNRISFITCRNSGKSLCLFFEEYRQAYRVCACMRA